jgi:Kef-type K+ transport system membrane component KefB
VTITARIRSACRLDPRRHDLFLPDRPQRRGRWGLSVALAYAIGGVLAILGVVDSLVYTGSAMATTAIGTLIPVLHDKGELQTRFGSYLLGAGAVGEFGPILLVTLFLSTDHPFREAVSLIAFVLLAVGIALLSMGGGAAGMAGARADDSASSSRSSSSTAA